MNKKILEQFELLIDMIKSNLNTARKEGESKEITRNTFSIEGKGDLFNRYFSHFEYEILINTK